ncbi:mucin-2-like isoform X2 [Numida meleagris]|uniref:mucin-2-like isoform X2 n=1 Tax=Numida meleagris TaxID=8996 RepID=UPI000B3D93C5|nr:mucin-2-like isoform X2 [Numida meleagris]
MAPTSSKTTTTSTTVLTKTTSPPATSTTTIASSSPAKSVSPSTKGTTSIASTSATTTTPASIASTTKTTPVTETTATTVLTPRETTTITSNSAITKISPIPTDRPTAIATTPTNGVSSTKTSPSGTEFTVPTSTSSPPSSSTTFTPATMSTVATQSIAQSPSASSSAATSPSSHLTSTSAFSSSSLTTTFSTPCFCHVFGDLFSPGEVVYNRTDKAGCNFYALCSNECEIAPFQGPCPSTTPLTSVFSETTTEASSSAFSSASTATSLTTLLERNCTDVSPPRKPGEKWTSECQECVCDPRSATAQCQPHPCQIRQEVVCDIGFISSPVVPVEDPCCPELICREINNTCEVNGTKFLPGTSLIDSCKNCTCSSEKDPVTGKNIAQCEELKCETSCPPGYEYKIKNGECCGKCVEVACRIRLSNNTVYVLRIDEILPLDLCSHYKCEKIEDQFVAVQTKRICPEYNPLECDPDEAETTPDGCCKICKPTNCKAYSTKTVIRHEDCESSEAVELTHCEGTCPGSSVYSLEANQMQHECTCCQEVSSHRRDVILNCQNGTSINYNYVYVEQCQCMNACNSQTPQEDDYPSKIGQTWT